MNEHSEVRFVNLTPHALNIELRAGDIFILPPSGTVARVAMETRKRGGLALPGFGVVNLTTTVPGEVTGLPPPVVRGGEEGVWYIVSALVRLAVPERRDVLSPGDLIRDENGNPRGCRGLVMNP